ncbi:MAG: glycine zipper 2TM domain-containing protein [Thermodesulfobacteriota bacterium]
MRRGRFNLIPILGLAALLLAAGCAGVRQPSRAGYEGGAVGAGVGAAAGALIDSDNRWRGGVIGGALGALLGGAVSEIGQRASQEAAYANQPVVYTSQGGGQRVEAVPYGGQGNCRLVKERYYEHGRLVREIEREVCR